jgi:hypothetical protein
VLAIDSPLCDSKISGVPVGHEKSPSNACGQSAFEAWLSRHQEHCAGCPLWKFLGSHCEGGLIRALKDPLQGQRVPFFVAPDEDSLQ